MYHYYMFHKPYGCVTARRDDRFPTVMDYFKELNNPNLSPVGRLDRETEGLLFITDDGKWNQRMTNPIYKKEKVYEFLAMGVPTEEIIGNLEAGVLLIGSNQPTKPCKVEVGEKMTLADVIHTLPEPIQESIGKNRPDQPVFYGKITITEGRKRQIRRMFKSQRCMIMYLKRLSMDGISLDENLKPGEWKEITPC